VRVGWLQWGARDKRGHSFISHPSHTHTHTHTHKHTHTHPSLTGLSSLLSQASLVLSVSLKRKMGEERGRRRERWRKDVREGVGKGGRKKRTTSDFSFLFPAKSSTHPPPPNSITSLWGKEEQVAESSLCSCAFPFHLFPPFISLIVSFSSHPPVASPHPHSSLPLFLCPSLALPGACLSGSVPVCLFADDSTWSRCDAQQLLLCSAASPLPPPPFTSTSISFFASPSTSLMFLFIYVFFCFSVTPLLKCKLASFIFYFVLRSVLSSLTSLTNSFQSPAPLCSAAINGRHLFHMITV